MREPKDSLRLLLFQESLMIRNKQKYRDAHVKTKRTSNPDSRYRHRAILLKIRIKIEIEQITKDTKNVQFDIEALRENPTHLTKTLNEQEIMDMVPNKDKLPTERLKKQVTQIKLRNAETWRNVSKRHGEIQKTHFPTENTDPTKRPMGKTRKGGETEKH